MVNVFLKLGSRAARDYLKLHSGKAATTKIGKIALKAWEKQFKTSATKLKGMARQRLALDSHKATNTMASKFKMKSIIEKDW